MITVNKGGAVKVGKGPYNARDLSHSSCHIHTSAVSPSAINKRYAAILRAELVLLPTISNF